MSQVVVHRDGTTEPFHMETLIAAIRKVVNDTVTDANDAEKAMIKIIKNVELKLPDEVATNELDMIVLKAITPMISDDTIYDDIATLQLAKIINKNVGKRFTSFRDYIAYGAENKLLDKRLLDFDIDQLEALFDFDRDKNFNYFGLSELNHRYLIKDRSGEVIEKPQWMCMRVGMGLALNEKEDNRETFAISVYHKFSQLKYTHSTPTIFNSGTTFPQMSSCYINVVGDSMESIMDKAKEEANFAKFAGGTGTSVTKLRANGSQIKSINSKSSGPIPFIKIYDTIISGVAIGGKRASSMVVYMEPWHLNIKDFLDLKDTNGNPYVRTPSLNTALWIPDEFMKRVENNEDRYLFDPGQFPELAESRGEEFEKNYINAIKKAESDEIILFEKIPAIDLYKKMLFKLAKTGNFWLNFKDTHNRVNQAPSYNIIHSSNLCTEISIPNSEESTAVCTLASLNLSRHLHEDKMEGINLSELSLEQKIELINREEMKETIRVAIQALDNVVDLNFYPSEESKKGSLDLRPLGLGLYGLAEMFIKLHVHYDSEDAINIADKIGERMYSNALEKSKELAQEKGAFRDYDVDKYDYEPRRNALLLAIAPTASTSLIAGTSSTVDPYFANVYSRETLGGKFTIIIKQLVKQLKDKGMWTPEIKQQIIANNGSVQQIPELAEHIDVGLFKTSYESGRKSQIDIAATLQKHVDQSISRNMYLLEEERANMQDVYMYAWKQGLKGTYYCFIQKNIQGEKYTQSVNKRGERSGFRKMPTTEVKATEDTAKKGFAAGKGFGTVMQTQNDSLEELKDKVAQLDMNNLSDEDKVLIEKKLRLEKGDEYFEKLQSGELYQDACPSDPYEAVMCESCQG